MKRAGSRKNTEPTLMLTVTDIDEERKWVHCKTAAGTAMLLAYDGKADYFHLHSYSPRGKLGGRVYNNWVLTDSIREVTEDW